MLQGQALVFQKQTSQENTTLCCFCWIPIGSVVNTVLVLPSQGDDKCTFIIIKTHLISYAPH